MTDIELCAKAMDLNVRQTPVDWGHQGLVLILKDGYMRAYDPIHDDAQCMALVKRFGIKTLEAAWNDAPKTAVFNSPDLNRAIVSRVARCLSGL